MNDKKKKIVFCITLVGFILTMGYRLNHPYVQPRVAALTHASNIGPGGEIKDNVIYEVGEKRSATYSNELFAYFFNKPPYSAMVHRDLFSLSGQNTQEIDVPDIAPVVEPVGKEESMAPDPLKEAVAYISSLTLLGWFERKDERAVFFRSNEAVMVVRAGERLNEKYVVESIDANGITIRVLEINETIHLDTRGYNEK